MKRIKNWLIFSLLLTTICCISNCNPAYAQTVPATETQVIERLPDGSIIVAVDGAKYRALTPDQIRQIQILKVNFQSAVEENAVLSEKNEKLLLAIQTANKDRAIADGQIVSERKRGDEFRELFERERALRKDAEKLPGKKSVFEKILSHPVVQIAVVAVAGVVAVKK